MSLTAPPRLTWSTLISLLPELERMRLRAAAVAPGDDPEFCANDVWFERFKPDVVRLVGWETRSSNPILQTSEAYSLAYQTIYNELPSCGRQCGCF